MSCKRPHHLLLVYLADVHWAQVQTIFVLFMLQPYLFSFLWARTFQSLHISFADFFPGYRSWPWHVTTTRRDDALSRCSHSHIP